MYWEVANVEAKDGFEIVLSVTPEDMPPDWDETEEQRAETLRKIDQGVWVYFIARVEACKDGIALGTSYLGGCCYDSVHQFVKESDYYEDMVHEAIEEARARINRFKEAS
jgi:hypothetical protein